MKKLLVTGSSGLIGSEVVRYFDDFGWRVFGIDNNMRADFFGPSGDTRWMTKELENTCHHFKSYDLDIRDRSKIRLLFEELRPDYICHAAAQPSHDLAASRPFDDFEVNALGTLNLLEAARQWCPASPFVHMSSNKVYGDAPNRLELVELETRYDYADPKYHQGIDETFTIDQSKHSLFGASKVAADIMVQEYGRYFGMPTCVLRGGCLTGPNHSGVEMHGFLSYLIQANLSKTKYTIFGYQGKQVRDNIHAYDVARFMQMYFLEPRPGAVYNIGGGRENSISIREAFQKVEAVTGIPMHYEYSSEHRSGDHICYISDLSKMKRDYPRWSITRDLDTVFQEIADSWLQRMRQVEPGSV